MDSISAYFKVFCFFFFVHICAEAQQKGYVSLTSPVENWEEVYAESGVDRVYQIQGGDTLYGISKTFFGDPHFWPKIWSLNSNLTNPHIIEIGDYIYFSEGTAVKPSSFGMSNAKSANYTYIKASVKPMIPPNKIERKEAVALPSSLPQIFKNSTQSERQRIKNSILKGKRYVDTVKRSYPITTELVTSEPIDVGYVKSVQSTGGAAFQGMYVKVKLQKYFELGDKLRIFKTISKKESQTKRGMKVIRWLGELEIVAKEKSEKTYIGYVNRSYSLVSLGARLSTEEIKEVSLDAKVLDETEVYQTKPVKILGASGVLGRKVISQGELVYLNRGQKDSLYEGAVIPVYASSGSIFFKKRSDGVVLFRGRLYVAKVGPDYSTAILFESTDSVSSGDGNRI